MFHSSHWSATVNGKSGGRTESSQFILISHVEDDHEAGQRYKEFHGFERYSRDKILILHDSLNTGEETVKELNNHTGPVGQL